MGFRDLSLLGVLCACVLSACSTETPDQETQAPRPARAAPARPSPSQAGRPVETPAGTPAEGDAKAAPAGSGRHRLAFTEVTAAAGLGSFRHETGAAGRKWFPETMGAGAAFLDYDGDGWLDVLLVGGATWKEEGGRPVPALWLYRNLGDGRFALRTREAGLGGVEAYGFGVWVADYDNDGDQDFFFTTLGDDLLFRNDGGVFKEVGAEAGVRGEPGWSTSAVFFDADLDGRLDLYVGGYVEWSPRSDLLCSLDGQTKSYCTPELYQGRPGRFYHNEGHGRFSDQTASRGFGGGRGKTLGSVAVDYDADGRPDLYVANDTEPNLLYQNRGDGPFAEVGVESGAAFDENGRARAGMGVDTGVVDETGRTTLFVGNFSKEMIGVYRYAGDGVFEDRAVPSRIGMESLLTLTFGLVLADFDLDGDLDLFAANGHVHGEVERSQEGISYRQPPQLFLNDGHGVFEDAAPRIGGPLAVPRLARGAAAGDYDRDGDLDLLVTENGGPVHLWRNETSGGAGTGFLRVRLMAPGGNRDGVGARIEVRAGGRGMEREVRAGASYLSSSELTATFGLAPARRADRVRVRWPGGATVELADVPADRQIVISGPDR